MQKKLNKKQVQTVNTTNVVVKPISSWYFLRKVLLLFFAVIIVIIYTDKKGYFIAEQANNHIRRKWESFYNFTETKEVDVLILGNSHIITGIDPFVLSTATSSNCFILGNSGTGIIDAWFQLGGALKHTKPKLVILETYCINNDEEEHSNVTPFLQSFDAQKDVLYKLKSMPQLFSTDQWLEAWSPSIRNHSFLLTDTARINYNVKNPPKKIDLKKLDLGRFSRFTYGLQDSTLIKYDSIGAPVKGEEYKISEFSEKYLQKIMEICRTADIPILFLTVPMYYKHISNYKNWKTKLANELNKYPDAKWFDLQMPYDTLSYSPEMFENTYAQNQHLSNSGMIITAYKVAEYIDINYPNLLPNRSNQTVWINDFKNTEHFVYNQDVVDGMVGYSSIVKNKTVDGFHIRELAQLETEEMKQFILKINKQTNSPAELNVQCKVAFNGNSMDATIKMYKVTGLYAPKHNVYLTNLNKGLIIYDILSIK